jgi:hypothetical protein
MVNVKNTLNRITKHFAGLGRHVCVDVGIESIRFDSQGNPNSAYVWNVWVADGGYPRVVIRQSTSRLEMGSLQGQISPKTDNWDDNGVVPVRNSRDAIDFLSRDIGGVE